MTVAISIKDLHKTYANGFEALKGISLEVQQGDFFALLGPNGAGKSTTIGVIATLVKRTSGHVQVFGKNVDTHVYETKLDLDEGSIIENTNMKDLLAELDSQTFIFDSTVSINFFPELQFENVSVRKIDENSLEVTVSHGKNINEVFSALDERGVNISSMRNKTNRLEQLFISRLNENGDK